MRPPADLLAHYSETAMLFERSIAGHRAAGRWVNVYVSTSVAAQCRLVGSMIGWRTGQGSPRAELRRAFDVSEAAMDGIERVDQVARWQLDPVPGAYAALLLGETASRIIREPRRAVEGRMPSGIQSSVQWEAALFRSMASDGPDGAPSDLANNNPKARRALEYETYRTYLHLTSQPTSANERVEATEAAVGLYRRRKRDAFMAGGLEYLGGGDLNEVCVDFRLAAIWHVRGWNRDTLTPEARVHVDFPGKGA